MRTGRSDRRPVRGAVAALACLAVLAGCSDDPAPTPGAAPSPTAGKKRDQPRPAETVEAPDVVRSLNRLLDQRVAAVRDGDRERFLAAVAPDLQAEQATYFDNLAMLPLAELGLYADPGTLVRDGGAYWVEVEVTVQLDGFDAVPVRTRDRYLFTEAGRGSFRLASTTDEAWEADNEVRPQPWDTGPLTVVRGPHVLGLFDAGAAAQARRLVGDTERAVSAVAAAVPGDWDRSVVLYGLADPSFLEGLDGLPGDDPLALDAVAFPVIGAGEDLASTRVVLNPTTLTRPGPVRDRLLRHELTHVALGARQDDVPTWLAEGLAEYVSVRPLAPEDRAVSGAAVEAAEDGPTALPADEDFRAQREASYGLAWWACEAVVETYGEGMLWVLLDAMDGPDAPEDVLVRTLGLREAQLARKAGRLLLATYRPEDESKDGLKDGPKDGSDDGQEDGGSDEPGDGEASGGDEGGNGRDGRDGEEGGR